MQFFRNYHHSRQIKSLLSGAGLFQVEKCLKLRSDVQLR